LLSEPDQAKLHHHIERPEAFILDLCIRYLLLDEIGSTSLFSEEQLAIDELPHDVDLFNDRESTEYDRNCTWEAWEEKMIHYDPIERGFGEFFVYASSHWLKHFGAIDSGPPPCLAEIESLSRAGSTRRHNWINPNCRPDCAIKARFEFHSHLYGPLSITTLYGSDAIFRNMLENSNFDKDIYFPLPATAAAHQILQWGDLSRLRVLFLQSKLGCEFRNLDIFRLIIGQWSNIRTRHDDWELAFSLVDSLLDTLVENQWGNELLCIAARAGCMPMIQRLFNHAQHKTGLRIELLRGIHSIEEAVLGNHVDVVEYLRREPGFEAQLQHLNSDDENILHIASGHCNPAMFHLLVPRLQRSIHQTDGQGNMALMQVINSRSDSQNRYECAIILLSHDDADGKNQNGDGQQDPLQVAVQLGDTEMCRILICEGGMNPLSALTRNHAGQFVLKFKSWVNEEVILSLLQEHACDYSTNVIE
jgi:hypothetical protein